MENPNEEAKDTQPLFSIHIEWAEGHGIENESDAADGAKVAKEFFDSNPTEDDMPASINAITIKRI